MRPSFWTRPVSKLMHLACILYLVLGYSGQAFSKAATDSKSDLEIGSFNIQVFGESKVNKPFVSQTLLAIISRYDIIAIQEIRDDKNKAIYRLLEDLNKSTGKNYHALVSKRMGRGDMKEQYAYFFDSRIVKASESYVFDDKGDDFAREPFIARFEGLGREFTLANIHIAPTNVRGELKALSDVHRDIRKRFKDDSMFIMGDFNADCIYYKPAEGFDYFDVSPRLLVANDIDTTVSPTSCAYDRVLGWGPILDHAGDAKAFNFMEEFGYDLASSKLISDHYPIGFTINGSRTVSVPVMTPPLVTAEAPTAEGKTPALPNEALQQEILKPAAADACGMENYTTVAGYCYGAFEKGKKRVSESCCPAS